MSPYRIEAAVSAVMVLVTVIAAYLILIVWLEAPWGWPLVGLATAMAVWGALYG